MRTSLTPDGRPACTATAQVLCCNCQGDQVNGPGQLLWVNLISTWFHWKPVNKFVWCPEEGPLWSLRHMQSPQLAGQLLYEMHTYTRCRKQPAATAQVMCCIMQAAWTQVKDLGPGK